jgi:Aspartate decarboxylase
MTKYMLQHKLHFISVNTIYTDDENKQPILYCGIDILKDLLCFDYLDNLEPDINNILNKFEWHYWSRLHLHRYANIKLQVLDEKTILPNIGNIFAKNDIGRKILGVNFMRHNIIDNFHNSNIDLDIAVVASFAHVTNQQILSPASKKARILIFDRYQKHNIHKQEKEGVDLKSYLENQQNVDINNQYKPYKFIKNITLTHSLLDYEGSTGIDAKVLQSSGILPQEMVYFYHADGSPIYVNKQQKDKLCTYAILEQAGSGLWTANGGIAHYLEQYTSKANALMLKTI